MKPSVEQIGSLLALKRHERPEDGYWQDFLCDFHQNQRELAVRKSGLMSFASRISGWFSDLGPSKWAYGAGLAYASIAAFALLTPKEAAVQKMAPSQINYQVVPAPAPPAEQLDQLDLSPSTQGNAGEQVF